MNKEFSSPTVVTDVNIPFGRMVAIMLKLMLAAIPAIILFNIVFVGFAIIAAALLGQTGALLESLGR